MVGISPGFVGVIDPGSRLRPGMTVISPSNVS
jgi:hypothetical protein